MNFICEPEDMARSALFLCSDDARHINGAIVPVDGGWSAVLDAWAIDFRVSRPDRSTDAASCCCLLRSFGASAFGPWDRPSNSISAVTNVRPRGTFVPASYACLSSPLSPASSFSDSGLREVVQPVGGSRRAL